MDLIIGGAGFVGQAMVLSLKKQGQRVRVLDPSPFPQDAPVQPDESLTGDITSRAEVDRAVRGIEVVYHLAGPSVRPSRPDWRVDARAEGLRSILEAGLRSCARKVVFVSSGLVYGGGLGRPSRETDPLMPLGPHAESLVAAERICQRFCQTRLEVAILRPAVVPQLTGDGFFSKILNRLKTERAVWLPGDGGNRCHLTGVRDLARACVLAARPGLSGVFNIGVVNPTPIGRLFAELSRSLAHRPAIHFLPLSLARAALRTLSALDLCDVDLEQLQAAGEERILDTSLAERRLGFKAESTDLEVLETVMGISEGLQGQSSLGPAASAAMKQTRNVATGRTPKQKLSRGHAASLTVW